MIVFSLPFLKCLFSTCAREAKSVRGREAETHTPTTLTKTNFKLQNKMEKKEKKKKYHTSDFCCYVWRALTLLVQSGLVVCGGPKAPVFKVDSCCGTPTKDWSGITAHCSCPGASAPPASQRTSNTNARSARHTRHLI